MCGGILRGSGGTIVLLMRLRRLLGAVDSVSENENVDVEERWGKERRCV